MATINLDELMRGRVRNLTGQERGVAAREMFKLDELDQGSQEITVEVPEYVEGITTSFFQGMFAKSVRAASDRFLERYHFQASPAVMEQVLRGIERVKTKRGSALG